MFLSMQSHHFSPLRSVDLQIWRARGACDGEYFRRLERGIAKLLLEKSCYVEYRLELESSICLYEFLDLC